MKWCSLCSPEEAGKKLPFGGREWEKLSCSHHDCRTQAYHYSDNRKGEGEVRISDLQDSEVCRETKYQHDGGTTIYVCGNKYAMIQTLYLSIYLSISISLSSIYDQVETMTEELLFYAPELLVEILEYQSS